MHRDEYQIDEKQARRLIIRQMPDWSDLPITRVASAGTVNHIFRLGDDKVIRMPRTPTNQHGPENLARCLPIFTEELPLQVPKQIGLGWPSNEYPSHWSVLSWITGEPSTRDNLNDLASSAQALGELVGAMRAIPTASNAGAKNYRAGQLSGVDADFRGWLGRLPHDIDRDPLLQVWESCLATDEWGGPPTWLHTDLRGDNLMSHGGQLVGVIDWDDVSVGDPAADLLAAWWLFDGETREVFRSAVKADRRDWKRAQGWALHMAVAALPYYSESNPAFVRQARRAIAEILTDE